MLENILENMLENMIWVWLAVVACSAAVEAATMALVSVWFALGKCSPACGYLLFPSPAPGQGRRQMLLWSLLYYVFGGSST